jgi:hypothetical protein
LKDPWALSRMVRHGVTRRGLVLAVNMAFFPVMSFPSGTLISVVMVSFCG